jgi:hypothetical protein
MIATGGSGSRGRTSELTPYASNRGVRVSRPRSTTSTGADLEATTVGTICRRYALHTIVRLRGERRRPEALPTKVEESGVRAVVIERQNRFVTTLCGRGSPAIDKLLRGGVIVKA